MHQLTATSMADGLEMDKGAVHGTFQALPIRCMFALRRILVP